MSNIICPKCGEEISELEESCPVCGFAYLQDGMNFLLNECHTQMQPEEIIRFFGTDYKESKVKDKRYAGPDSRELRYDKDCFGLDGTMWFVLKKDRMKKASWYFVGRASEEYAGKAAEISEYLHTRYGDPVSKDMSEGFSGELKWNSDTEDEIAFECSVFDGWIHILVSIGEKES